jgi:hypothetical protein
MTPQPGACGGPAPPAQIVGSGVVDGVELSIPGTLVCLPGGKPIAFRFGFGFVFSPASGTLTDGTAVVWHRAGTPITSTGGT